MSDEVYPKHAGKSEASLRDDEEGDADDGQLRSFSTCTGDLVERRCAGSGSTFDQQVSYKVAVVDCVLRQSTNLDDLSCGVLEGECAVSVRLLYYQRRGRRTRCSWAMVHEALTGYHRLRTSSRCSSDEHLHRTVKDPVAVVMFGKSH